MKKMLKKLAFFSFLLALVAGTIAFVYFEKSSFSQADLKVEIIGPEEFEVAEEVEYKIRYRNNSDTRLEDVSVVFEYPEASVPVEEDEEEITMERDTFRRIVELPNINPGQEETIEFKAKIFGMERDSVKASAWFNYSPQNLSASYEEPRTHTGIITEVPLSFEFDLPSEMKADEEFPFRMRYFSQLEGDLTDLEIRIDYPSDFKFLRSTPAGIEDDQWGKDLLPGNEGGVIEIFGSLEGEQGDIKGFKAELGVWKFDKFIPLRKIEGEILIPQPSLYIDPIINDSSDYVAGSGEDLFYEIYFKNVGDSILEDLFLTVDLDTELMDMDGVDPLDGRFQKNAGTITWSHASVSRLRRLYPDDEEKISFWSKVKETDLPYNPEIRTSINLDQTRTEIRTKVNTDLKLFQDFADEENVLSTVGPFPLRLNRPSSYTVYWTVENFYNDVEDVKIVAELPEDASIVEKYPEDSELNHDTETGEVIWELEKIERGAGVSRKAPEIYFQVEIIPISSVDEDFELISEAEISGEDAWTEKEVTHKVDGLTHENLLDFFDIDPEEPEVEIEPEEDEEETEDEEDNN